MSKKVTKWFGMIFGTRPKIVFKRVMIVLSTIIIAIILIQNISCGYNKEGFYFKWGPAARIEVKKEL